MNFNILDKKEYTSIELEKFEKDGIYKVDVLWHSDTPIVPEKFSVRFSFPSVDCYSVFSPALRNGRSLERNYFPQVTNSRLASWMPLHAIVSLSGKNRATIALSDATTPTSISTGVTEYGAQMECTVNFFTIPTTSITDYKATVYVDMRDIPYYDSVYDVVAWWEKECGYTPAFVPECARQPVNSLWYSYHQKLEVESIIRECRLSKELGMDTVIIDDGWQTDINGGYSYCGDWKVAKSKIPDMAQFIERIHETGMKAMLWYSVPYVGINSENYERFKDMLLKTGKEGGQVFAFDPRYKEVRDFLVGVYRDAVVNWKLDGLKLDFIDRFAHDSESIKPDSRRDMESLEDAIDVLMCSVKDALTEVNPDIMIEFRQTYVGPSIRKYGNMFRVTDCPNDAIKNRYDVINLRLTSGKTAVHSDMLLWNVNDPVENAALQLASALYSVPQVSMRIENLPEDHIKMLKFYLTFFKEWQSVLLDGKITAANPEALYSYACSTLGNKSVITAYCNVCLEVKTDIAVIVNAAATEKIAVKGAAGKKFKVIDCMGNELCKGTISCNLEEVSVPLSGMIFIN